MRIENTGRYCARGFSSAEVFAIRGEFCLGYVAFPDFTRKASVWRVKDGTTVGGTPEEDLVEFYPLAKPRFKGIGL